MKAISTKDYLLNGSKKSLLSIYVYSNASSVFRFLTEQSLQALAGCIPTPIGILIRGFLYKFLVPRNSCTIYAEVNVDIKYFNKIWCGKSVFIDRNSRIHSSLAGIYIGDNSRIMYGSYVCAFSSKVRVGEGISIGKSCWIGINCVLAAGEAKIIIGDNTLIGPNVTIVTGNHQFKSGKLILEQAYEQLPISIGENCWIGSNSVILGGVTIGNHSVVAAGAVVTRDVASGSIVGGVPAKVIGAVN